MRNSVLAAMAIGIAAMLAGGQAEAAKKIHRSHNAYQSRGPAVSNPDPSGGNAAAGGNNANSMNGSNSAGENANGRTGGGRG
jgi:aldehyde:ferredoxin oxidoreductase